jgi:5-methylcytosine-specific restriction endonuclease McrA
LSEVSKLIGTILRHDAKSTSYKLALIRALNDVVLAFPHMGESRLPVAVPVGLLAERWVAYYWPFTHPDSPIIQGHTIPGRQDMSFRRSLHELQQEWINIVGTSKPSDGFFLVSELKIGHRRRGYPESLIDKFREAVSMTSKAIELPLRHAGPGRWSVFAKPQLLRQLSGVVPTPGASSNERCVVLDPDLWNTFRDLSLWVEALCIHEWCLYTESIDAVGRGDAYVLLTQRPDNRRPLTWERNQIELLMMDGHEFVCPWTNRPLDLSSYDMDHIIPISVYPLNEMWNLVPSDRKFNQHTKRDRLPSEDRLSTAIPRFAQVYSAYSTLLELNSALVEDVEGRFRVDDPKSISSSELGHEVGRYVRTISESLNLATF